MGHKEDARRRHQEQRVLDMLIEGVHKRGGSRHDWLRLLSLEDSMLERVLDEMVDPCKQLELVGPVMEITELELDDAGAIGDYFGGATSTGWSIPVGEEIPEWRRVHQGGLAVFYRGCHITTLGDPTPGRFQLVRVLHEVRRSADRPALDWVATWLNRMSLQYATSADLLWLMLARDWPDDEVFRKYFRSGIRILAHPTEIDGKEVIFEAHAMPFPESSDKPARVCCGFHRPLVFEREQAILVRLP